MRYVLEIDEGVWLREGDIVILPNVDFLDVIELITKE